MSRFVFLQPSMNVLMYDDNKFVKMQSFFQSQQIMAQLKIAYVGVF